MLPEFPVSLLRFRIWFLWEGGTKSMYKIIRPPIMATRVAAFVPSWAFLLLNILRTNK